MRLPFPFMGVNKGKATVDQPPLTVPDMKNVRVYDILGNRARGGQRPGLNKLYTDQIAGTAGPIVAICSVTTVSD
jgi:hypothetical protein